MYCIQNALSCSCSDEGRSLLRLVSPGWRKTLDLSVISSKSVDSGFDENKSEFTVSIGSESFDMLSHVNGLLDKMV